MVLNGGYELGDAASLLEMLQMPEAKSEPIVLIGHPERFVRLGLLTDVCSSSAMKLMGLVELKRRAHIT